MVTYLRALAYFSQSLPWRYSIKKSNAIYSSYEAVNLGTIVRLGQTPTKLGQRTTAGRLLWPLQRRVMGF